MNDNNDKDFENNLVEQLSEIIPSEQEVMNTNPWSEPIGLITWGLAISMFQLNFLYLQYILPTVGVLLLYFGFRSLRDENVWFKLCWLLSILRLVEHLIFIFIEATPLTNWNKLFFYGMGFAVQMAILLLLRKALKTSIDSAGRTPQGDPLITAGLWMSILYFIALVHMMVGLIIVIILLISFILILRSLFNVGEYLDDSGYYFKVSPVKVSSNLFSVIFISFVLFIIAIGCIASNHLKVSAQEYKKPEMTQLRDELVTKGFPSDLLQVLSEQDIEAMKNVRDIQVPKISDNLDSIISFRNDKMEPKVVFVRTKENVIYVLQYFRWVEGNAHWQDGFQIIPDSNAQEIQLISSGLMFEKKNKTYLAPFPRIKCENTSYRSFFGENQAWQIYGAYNFPFGTKNQQGYILYSYSIPEQPFVIGSFVNYVHNRQPFMLPYSDTDAKLMDNGYSVGKKKRQYKFICE